MANPLFPQGTSDFPSFSAFYPPSPLFCGILSIPHSGEMIPAEFIPYLNENRRDLDRDLDYAVDQLVDINQLNQKGIAVIVAKIHRVAVDLNRSAEKAVLHWEYNTWGVKIRQSTPTPEQLLFFQETYYNPYFKQLDSWLQTLQQKNAGGKISVIDLHSMPSKPTAYHFKQNPKQKEHRADFCISDLKGQSCEQEYIISMQKLLSKLHYETSINDPYVGGFITEYFNTHKTKPNAIQIETKRGIYMDEDKQELIQEKSEKVKQHLTSALIEFFHMFSSSNN